MLKRIDSIENFGIFQDYKSDASLKEFSNYNLFYGWNGSGKSTLSKIFRALETKQLPEKFENAKFKLTLDNDTFITTASLENFNENIYVYNTDFIKKNIDWDETINSILILSEENIEETREFNVLNDELNGDKKLKKEGLILKHSNKQQESNVEKEKTEKILTNAAKNIKNSLGVIATNDIHYLNYNKTKLKSFIDKNMTLINDSSNTLSDNEVKNCIKQARPEQKDLINNKPNKIDSSKISALIMNMKEVINRKISANVIQRLKENTDISAWVEKGIEIHKNYSSKICEFCGQPLPKLCIGEYCL